MNKTNISLTLLTEREFKKHKRIIKALPECWWLRTFVDNSYFVCGIQKNKIHDFCSITVPEGVRPAVRFVTKPHKSYKRGKKINIGNYIWTILEVDPFYENGDIIIFALCDDIIAKRKFDAVNNYWHTSELKQWIETDGLNLIFAN